jgi:hypothetical protein
MVGVGVGLGKAVPNSLNPQQNPHNKTISAIMITNFARFPDFQ